MRITVSLRADDLLALRRSAHNRLDSGEAQFAVKTGEPYLYATADELDSIAYHFNALATRLRKEPA
jgi:hypothetical protein